MADSTLSLVWKDLQAQIGLFLGWGRGALAGDPAWTDFQQGTIDMLTSSGLRQFYYPAPLAGERGSYSWSFLTPTASLSLAEGETAVQLPDDYGGVEGQVTVATDDTVSQPWPIEWRNEGQLRQMYSVTPEMTGPPMYVATQPLKGTSLDTSNRWQLFFFPEADQTYTVQLQYYIAPDALSAPFPRAYGGAAHSETILALCIAAAELYLDDARGPRWQYAQERLAASASMDRRNKPQKLGYNRDRSDSSGQGLNPHWWAPPATYNGNSFG